jgi:hypothetical protein|nr:MAG TPA: hypothetical protein [Caudoviricetes sp.]
MKKIFRLLLLGFLSVAVLSPSVVIAEEQTVQEPSSSVYSEIDGIAPMGVPDSETVTIGNGEYYDFVRKTIVFPRYCTGGRFILIEPVDKIASYQRYTSFHNDDLVLEPRGDEKFLVDFSTRDVVSDGECGNSLTSPKVILYGYRLRNYEAGPVTFKVSLEFNVTPIY